MQWAHLKVGPSHFFGQKRPLIKKAKLLINLLPIQKEQKVRWANLFFKVKTRFFSGGTKKGYVYHWIVHLARLFEPNAHLARVDPPAKTLMRAHCGVLTDYINGLGPQLILSTNNGSR